MPAIIRNFRVRTSMQAVLLKKSGWQVKMWKNYIVVFVFLIFSIGYTVSSPKGRNGKFFSCQEPLLVSLCL